MHGFESKTSYFLTPNEGIGLVIAIEPLSGSYIVTRMWGNTGENLDHIMLLLGYR
jgi:hypothetical protein